MVETTLIASEPAPAAGVDATKVAPAAVVPGATDGAAKVAGTDAGATPDAVKLAADAAAAEAAKVKSGAPATYAAFKLPDGVKLEDAQVADLQATAKDLNLTQDQAQKLVDRELKVRADTSAAAQTEFKSTVAKWADEARADKEIGGDKLTVALAGAKRGLEAMESQIPGLKSMLEVTGAGNHPLFIKLFQKIGGMTSEDGKFLAGGKQPAAANSEAAQAARMYPTMTKTG